MPQHNRSIEWPTWFVLAGCYAGWGLITWYWEALGPWIAFPLLIPLVTLHSSLQHEVLHGHPTRYRALNEALVYPAVGLMIPYRRFRDTHLKHHKNEFLTDPYDDPESWYLAERDWMTLSGPLRLILELNATLLGRFVLGPALGTWGLIRNDWREARAGDSELSTAWLHHVLGAIPVVIWVWPVCGMHPLLYLVLAAYPGFSLLMLRTYAEHRAEEAVPGRTAVIEASPFFGLLFLNNNLHAPHHERPALAWHLLPGYYRENRDRILRENGGYAYRGYKEIFRRFILRRREPIPHPFLRRGGEEGEAAGSPGPYGRKDREKFR